MTTILAIDPGTLQSGYVLWSADSKRVKDCGVLNNDEIRLLLKYTTGEGKCDQVAIEMIASYGMPVGAEVFATCLWIGRFIECCQFSAPRLIFRRDVKLHLCGTPRAKDANLRQALIDKLGNVGTKKTPGPLYGVKSHIWPALGVAITAAETKGE